MRSFYPLALGAFFFVAAGSGSADEAATPRTPTQRQMMKDCMAKQKASDGGMPKEDMKRNCRDVTKTESENAKAEDKAGEKGTAVPTQPTATP